MKKENCLLIQSLVLVHVTDIAGLIKGASTGAGLGNAFLSHITAVDGIFHVVRAFDSDEVIHVDDSVDPIRDLETIQGELCAKDLEAAKKAIEAEEVAVKKSQGKFKLSPTFLDVKEKILNALEKNIPVRAVEWSTGEVELINEKMRLITTKPCVYLVNLSKNDYVRKKNKWLPKIKAWIDEKDPGATMVPFSVEFEQELWNARDDPAAKEALLKGEGSPVISMLPKMITVGFSVLNLIYFFTAGEKEVRAWTVYSGATAPEAAGVGFKRSEPSEASARCFVLLKTSGCLTFICHLPPFSLSISFGFTLTQSRKPPITRVLLILQIAIQPIPNQQCIHSDFERGFIKAEVVAYDDFESLSGGQKSMAAVKAAGKYRIEGKSYVMQSGDIVHFQFNVTASGKK